MSKTPIIHEINQYIDEINRIYRAGNATEHTYRPALKSLLEKMTTGLTITNEPKRIACGAPDYIVTRKEIPIGYIEAKDIDTDLKHKSHKEQFDRYKYSLNNLIITDYLTFQLFENGDLITSVTIAKTEKNGIKADETQFETFAALINLFAGYEGEGILTSLQLSKVMAAKARLMANIIENALGNNEKDDNNSLDGQLKGFREVLIHDITYKEFADIYAQTIAYGMFAARLNSPPFLKEEWQPQADGVVSAQAGGGRVYINDTQYFGNIPFVAWNFYIGGYQPAQKWLKDRKGRTLNFEDIRHYQKMIWVLKKTEEVMRKVDEVMNLTMK